MGKRRRRAEQAIEAVQARARSAAEALVEDVEDTAGRAKRRTGKRRRVVDRSARKAEHKLGRFWNRGRFRVRRLRRKADKRIDQVMSKSQVGVTVSTTGVRVDDGSSRCALGRLTAHPGAPRGAVPDPGVTVLRACLSPTFAIS